jgi:hypothetical protein
MKGEAADEKEGKTTLMPFEKELAAKAPTEAPSIS